MLDDESYVLGQALNTINLAWGGSIDNNQLNGTFVIKKVGNKGGAQLTFAAANDSGSTGGTFNYQNHLYCRLPVSSI